VNDYFNTAVLPAHDQVCVHPNSSTETRIAGVVGPVIVACISDAFVPLSGTQELEDRQDPAMVGVGWREVELAEDVRNIFLDGARADPQGLDDPVV
jgi:hypothetical protein